LIKKNLSVVYVDQIFCGTILVEKGFSLFFIIYSFLSYLFINFKHIYIFKDCLFVHTSAGIIDSYTLREMCVDEMLKDPWYIVLFGGEIYDEDIDVSRRNGYHHLLPSKTQKDVTKKLVAQRQMEFDVHVNEMKKVTTFGTYVEVAAISALLRR
jgi:hypothetical protein